MTPRLPAAEIDRARRAIETLRKPDLAFTQVPNTVRQSVAEVIENLLAEIEAGRADAGRVAALEAEVTRLDKECDRQTNAAISANTEAVKLRAELHALRAQSAAQPWAIHAQAKAKLQVAISDALVLYRATQYSADKIALEIATNFFAENAKNAQPAAERVGGTDVKKRIRQAIDQWRHELNPVVSEEDIARLTGFLMAACDKAAPSESRMWLPISEADTSIAVEHKFPEMTIRHSYPSWVRVNGGKPFEAVWSDQGYWWALEAETPCEPDEFMPHPLAPPAGNGAEGGR